jgi:integrase
VEFFMQQCRNKDPDTLLFLKADGTPWGHSQQSRRMLDACKAANIEYMSFHGCRHTYAARLVMKGVPLAVVAAQLGHTSIKMVEKHYGHLAPGYVSDTIRQALTPIGFLRTSRD